MTEILNQKFSPEISNNILKYMSHPTADIIKNAISPNLLFIEMFDDEDSGDDVLRIWVLCGFLRYDCFECGKRKTRDMFCYKCLPKVRSYFS